MHQTSIACFHIHNVPYLKKIFFRFYFTPNPEYGRSKPIYKLSAGVLQVLAMAKEQKVAIDIDEKDSVTKKKALQKSRLGPR